MFAPAVIRAYLVSYLGLAERADLPAASLAARLEAIQIDPVNLMARNHELVLHNRLVGRRAGQAEYYQGEDRLFEYIAGNRALLPLRDLPLFVPFMRRREQRLRDELRRLSKPVRQVLREIEACGPLSSRRIQCGEKVHGYWDGTEPRTKETTLALHYLWESGRVAAVGRSGADNLYDLAERAFPADLLRRGEELSLADARRLLRHKYYRAFGVFDAQHQYFGWQHLTAAERNEAVAGDEREGRIEPLPIEGIKRSYWALAGTRDALDNVELREIAGVRFLSPLDNLLWRRERLEDLFGFQYRWEIYTPARKRTGGPYTMPVLQGTEFVGRLDARVDRRAGILIVENLRLEPGVKAGGGLKRALRQELDRLREFCGGARVVSEKAPHSDGTPLD